MAAVNNNPVSKSSGHMKLRKSIDRSVTKASKWALYISIFCLVVVMLLAAIDIITTKFFNNPIPSASEFIEDLNIPLVFMGMAYVQLSIGHLAGPIFERQFSQKVKNILALTSYTFGIILCGLISWRALSLLQEMLASNAYKMGTVKFPLWPFALVTFLGFVLLALAFIVSIIRVFAGDESNEGEEATLGT